MLFFEIEKEFTTLHRYAACTRRAMLEAAAECDVCAHGSADNHFWA
jgi:hypothetical protein